MNINYKKLIYGEPEFGSIYDDDEYKAIFNEYKKFKNSYYNPKKIIETFEKNFSIFVGSKYAVATNSGMSSLEILIQALLKEQSIVLTNVLNFAGTHISIVNNGHKIIFCESDETLNSNILDLKIKIKYLKPDLLLLTNMNGLAHNEKEIIHYINKYSPHTKLIVDCCRSLGSKYNFSSLNGSDSTAAFYSFQRKKQITTLGEGGMITTNDKELYEKCLKIRSFGFFQDNGQNYKITGMQAAVGIEQINKIEDLNNKRRDIALRRTTFLKDKHPDFTYPFNNDQFYNVFYLYSLLVPENWNVDQRNKLIEILKNKYGIGSTVANNPTYMSSNLISSQTTQKCSSSENISNRLICPIIHPNLNEKEQKYINESIHKAIGEIKNDILQYN